MKSSYCTMSKYNYSFRVHFDDSFSMQKGNGLWGGGNEWPQWWKVGAWLGWRSLVQHFYLLLNEENNPKDCYELYYITLSSVQSQSQPTNSPNINTPQYLGCQLKNQQYLHLHLHVHFHNGTQLHAYSLNVDYGGHKPRIKQVVTLLP